MSKLTVLDLYTQIIGLHDQLYSLKQERDALNEKFQKMEAQMNAISSFTPAGIPDIIKSNV